MSKLLFLFALTLTSVQSTDLELVSCDFSASLCNYVAINGKWLIEPKENAIRLTTNSGVLHSSYFETSETICLTFTVKVQNKAKALVKLLQTDDTVETNSILLWKGQHLNGKRIKIDLVTSSRSRIVLVGNLNDNQTDRSTVMFSNVQLTKGLCKNDGLGKLI